MRKDISQIAYETLYLVTNGDIALLNHVAINALLNDFLYVWLENIGVDYKFEFLNTSPFLVISSISFSSDPLPRSSSRTYLKRTVYLSIK